MRLEMVHLALVGGAHGAARAVHEHRHVHAGLLAQLDELAKSRLENALHAAGVVRELAALLVERAEVRAAPEAALELVGAAHGVADHEQLAENVVPRDQRNEQQQRHDQLHQHARVERPG